MNPGGRIIEVAAEQAALLDERYSDYRRDAVAALAAVIQLQYDGSGNNTRRERALKLVGDLGTKALAGNGDAK